MAEYKLVEPTVLQEHNQGLAFDYKSYVKSVRQMKVIGKEMLELALANGNDDDDDASACREFMELMKFIQMAGRPYHLNYIAWDAMSMAEYDFILDPCEETQASLQACQAAVAAMDADCARVQQLVDEKKMPQVEQLEHWLFRSGDTMTMQIARLPLMWTTASRATDPVPNTGRMQERVWAHDRIDVMDRELDEFLLTFINRVVTQS